LTKVYDLIITTPQIANEFGESLPDWIQIVMVKDEKYLESLETQVDRGEASAIALGKEIDNAIKARKLASKLNLKYTGTLGVFHKAKQMGFIERVKPLIDKLLKTDFRISENIVLELLKMNNELED